MAIAKGEFTVKMNPIDGSGVLKLDKQYSGTLEASGIGEMLASRSVSVEGSASYVAIEIVTGSMNGKTGSFTLVHRGVMQGEYKQLLITISPDSGTDELTGITGTMDIIIEEGKHFYVLEYALSK